MIDDIRQAANKGLALGNQRFVDEVNSLQALHALSARESKVDVDSI